MSLLGPELVLDGDFSSGDNWTEDVGLLVIGGKAECSGFPGHIEQSVSFVSGRQYYCSYDIVTRMSGDAVLSVGGTAGTTYSTTGTKTETITAGANGLLDIAVSDGPAMTIDNVSVKELSVADKIEKAIFDILRLDATVSGLVSSRIYPQVIPQNTSLPAIVFSQISGPRQHTITDTDNMVPSRWQFTVVAETYAELRGISDAVRGVLDNYTGVCGTVTIQCAHFMDEVDLTDIVPGTDKLRRYSKAIELAIDYNE